MKQFEGYAFTDWEPKDWKPGLNWVNGAEQGADVLESEYYKNLQSKMDSIYSETIIEIEKNNKKKEQENPDKSPVNETLTLYSKDHPFIESEIKTYIIEGKEYEGDMYHNPC
jgi:hypothetical protein